MHPNDLPSSADKVLSGDSEIPCGDSEIPSGDSEIPSGDSEIPSGDSEIPSGDSGSHSDGGPAEFHNLRTELDAARDRLELALTSGNIGMWDWNPATSEVFYSDTFKTQLGHPADAPWSSFVDWESRLHPDDRTQALQIVREYFDGVRPEYKSVFRLQCRDDSYRWFLAQGKAVFDVEGKPSRMTGVHVDITDRVNADRELQRVHDRIAHMNRALQESNVELQQFAYVASHDLQTPLRAIAGFSQFLQKDYAANLDEKGNHYIDRIVAGVKRMHTMIHDLLVYSRVESQAAEFQTVSLDEVLVDARSLLDSAIDECGGEVVVDPLPHVHGDAAQLSQLFTNLIGNALKYTVVPPRITITHQSQSTEHRVCVQDNGIGIAPKDHDKIFEVFRRLHSHDAFPGTGIGLAVCRRIIKRHGWTIEVDANPEGGTRFWISIPISTAKPPTS